MLEGETSSGFKFCVKADALDDWHILEIFREIDKGSIAYIVDVSEMLLGKTQYENLKDHVNSKCGKISMESMMQEINDILTCVPEIKN